MDKISFTVYDVFGYIIPGALLLFAIDHFLLCPKLFNVENPTVVGGLISFSLFYIVGHMIATPSASILETSIVKHFLKDPRMLLIRTQGKGCKLMKLFPGHFKPLPTEVREKILSKFRLKEKQLITTYESDVIFQIAFSKVKKDEKALARLSIFLNLYGFARNISFTCLFLALLLLINSFFTGVWKNYYCILSFLGVGIIMFYRFLKFYRHYTYDLYLSFLSYKEP